MVVGVLVTIIIRRGCSLLGLSEGARERVGDETSWHHSAVHLQNLKSPGTSGTHEAESGTHLPARQTGKAGPRERRYPAQASWQPQESEPGNLGLPLQGERNITCRTGRTPRDEPSHPSLVFQKRRRRPRAGKGFVQFVKELGPRRGFLTR